MKVMKAIVKDVGELEGPNLLLAKLMQYVKKRFPDNLELTFQFLEMVNFVYRDKSLKDSELTSKVEPAFISGLRCVQPQITSKFFELFDVSMRKRLADRLM